MSIGTQSSPPRGGPSVGIEGSLADARPSVGIDDINVYGSSLMVPARLIAEARAQTPEALAGFARLELVARSLPPAWEDPVTLAVEAARPVVAGREGDIGLCLVASESGIDDAKPLSSYVHRWLGLSERCRHAEVKHACYGGTAALQLAADWVRAEPRRQALVIASDMARRLFNDSAEPAEGAGAVAMLIAANPRVLALGEHSAVAAREVYDVMRPTRTAEVIHSQRSLAAYLDLLESAWEAFTEASGPDVFKALRYLLFHTPLIPLVKEAHRLIAGDTSFEELVRPSLAYGQALGNTYSGSLYVGLACLADHAALAEPAHVALYSYGSGSCAEVFDGWLLPSARAVVARHGIAARLAARRAVDLASYEALVLAHEASLSEPHFEPPGELPAGLYQAAYAGAGRLVLEHVRDHYRSYRWS